MWEVRVERNSKALANERLDDRKLLRDMGLQ
jgi:hypothetical protein